MIQWNKQTFTTLLSSQPFDGTWQPLCVRCLWTGNARPLWYKYVWFVWSPFPTLKIRLSLVPQGHPSRATILAWNLLLYASSPFNILLTCENVETWAIRTTPGTSKPFKIWKLFCLHKIWKHSWLSVFPKHVCEQNASISLDVLCRNSQHDLMTISLSSATTLNNLHSITSRFLSGISLLLASQKVIKLERISSPLFDVINYINLVAFN